MPLPGTRLIHPNFEQWGRQVAAGQMTAVCRIHRPSTDPVWDDALGRDVYPPPALLYHGPCRYQYQTPAGAPVVAEQPTPLGDIRITVDVGATPYRVNDLVTMAISVNNLDVTGRTLLVTAVSGSSISWQRDLTCQLRQPTTR